MQEPVDGPRDTSPLDAQAGGDARDRAAGTGTAARLGRVVGQGFVVVGPPAAGKSTVARLLASTAPAGVHVSVDLLREMVVSGLVLPGEDFSQPLVEQVEAARRVAVAALSTYTDLGFTTVLDDFLDPFGVREYDDLVGSGAAAGIVLLPNRDVAISRARNREPTAEGAAYICLGIAAVFSCLADVLPRLRKMGWSVLDNTELDPPETVSAILALTGRPGQQRDRPVGRPGIGATTSWMGR